MADLRRVVVVGTSCAGKTTFASELSRILDMRAVDLDQLYWGPNWTPKPKEEFLSLVDKVAADDRWIISGNYNAARDVVWPRATAVIWLNYGFPTIFARALYRTIIRCVTQQELCHGNRESFRVSFLSRDSILLWVMTTFRSRRRRFSELRKQGTYANVEWIEFSRPRQASEFLRNLNQSVASACVKECFLTD